MTYRNTPLSSTLLSPMQMLSNRITRSNLPLSTAARLQMELHINHHLPMHDLSINQTVMYQDPTTQNGIQ